MKYECRCSSALAYPVERRLVSSSQTMAPSQNVPSRPKPLPFLANLPPTLLLICLLIFQLLCDSSQIQSQTVFVHMVATCRRGSLFRWSLQDIFPFLFFFFIFRQQQLFRLPMFAGRPINGSNRNKFLLGIFCVTLYAMSECSRIYMMSQIHRISPLCSAQQARPTYTACLRPSRLL